MRKESVEDMWRKLRELAAKYRSRTYRELLVTAEADLSQAEWLLGVFAP